MAKPSRYLTSVVALLASILMLGSAAAVASTTSPLNSLQLVAAANDDLSSTATEWSGATYNADQQVLVTVDDETNAYEFALDDTGAIDSSIAPRIIDLDLGVSDFEGIAWIAGNVYAFLSEGNGAVVVASIPDTAPNGDTTVGTSDIVGSFTVALSSWGNLGVEGIATDGAAFYVTREMPATLMKFDLLGNYVGEVQLNTLLGDASGVATLPDGTFFVISHESRRVAHVDIEWNQETVTTLGTWSADAFSQLEGIAVVGNTELHLFGEQKNGGQTYAHLQGVLAPPSVSTADVDCSGDITIGDALLIAQSRANTVTLDPTCGSGDHNGDGVVNLGDAITIAQCRVGHANPGCPDV